MQNCPSLNTSHVTVNLLHPVLYMTHLLRLNTSHVTVNQLSEKQSEEYGRLNTSHVTVNRGQVAAGIAPHALFKYIPCYG